MNHPSTSCRLLLYETNRTSLYKTPRPSNLWLHLFYPKIMNRIVEKGKPWWSPTSTVMTLIYLIQTKLLLWWNRGWIPHENYNPQRGMWSNVFSYKTHIDGLGKLLCALRQPWEEIGLGQNCNRESKDCPRDIWFCPSPWHRPEALRVAIYRPSLPFLIMIGHILAQSAEFLSFLRWSLWFCWMTTNIWAFSTQNLLHLTVFSSMPVYLINCQLNSVSSSFDKVLTYLHLWSHRY